MVTASGFFAMPIAPKDIGQQRHQEGSGNGSEELVGVLRVQKPDYKSDQYPANTGAEAVQKIAAEQQPEAQCATENTPDK